MFEVLAVESKVSNWSVGSQVALTPVAPTGNFIEYHIITAGRLKMLHL
jgi:NADPH:quinone reductase-like Zn-dependent oxidoreductase